MDHKLSDHIATPDDLQLLQLEVARVIELSRDQALRKSKSARTPELVLSPWLIEFLGLTPGSAVPSVSQLEEVKSWLQHTHDTAPVVHLALAGLPAQSLKAEIVHWFRQEINPLTLVVFEYNRGLAGGFAIRLGSSLYDYSFKHAFLVNDQAMSKALQRV